MDQNSSSFGAGVEIYCDNCDACRPLQLGDWIRDGEYEFQDQLCGACHFIIATLRRPAYSVTVPAVHNYEPDRQQADWPGAAKRTLSFLAWLALMAAMAFVYYKS